MLYPIDSKGCLTTSCMKSSPKKTNDQCNSVTKTEDDPNYSHTINAFQESCNSREEKIVCCQPDSEECKLTRIHLLFIGNNIYSLIWLDETFKLLSQH